MIVNKISLWVLYLMMAISAIVIVAFYAGGSIDPEAEMLTPVYTDLLLNWMYALVGLGVLCTVVFSLYHFVMLIINSPKEAIQKIVVIAICAAVLFGAWSLGDGTPLSIPGYEGSENVEFWLKLTDMFLYTIYLLLGGAIAAIAVSSVAKMIRK